MFDIHFKRLCSLTVRHNYYADGFCRALSAAPLAGGTQLRSDKARFRPSAAGGEVYGQISNGTWQAAGPFPFRIGLFQADGRFRQITDPQGLPAPGASLLYFNNLGLNAAMPGQAFQLSPRAEPLPIAVSTLSVPLDPPVRDPIIQVARAHPAGQAASLETTLQGLVDRVDLALMDLPEGRYHLSVADQKVHDFYLLHQDPGPLLAVAEIYPGGADYPIDGIGGLLRMDGSVFERAFEIAFKAVKPHWRYILRPPRGSDGPADWEIARMGDAGPSFGRLSEGERLGAKVWVATSDAPEALRHRYAFTVVLRHRTEETEIGLPLLGPDSLIKQTGVGAGLVAEISCYP